MNTPLTDDERVRLDEFLKNHDAMSLFMLDGYLAAVSSGPTLVMPDRMLRWVWRTGCGVDKPQTLAIDNLIIQHYLAVNDALNADEAYVPWLASPRDWCRGYLAGFCADMVAWAPLTAAMPELLRVVLCYSAEAGEAEPQEIEIGAVQAILTDSVARIHAFWLARRQGGSLLDILSNQMPGAPCRGRSTVARLTVGRPMLRRALRRRGRVGGADRAVGGYEAG